MSRRKKVRLAAKVVREVLDEGAPDVAVQHRVIDEFVAELGPAGRRSLLGYFRSAAGQCRLRELEVNRALLARAKRRARSVFADEGMADDWLGDFSGALGATPLEMLCEPNGYAAVVRELAAIEHGLSV